MGVLYVVDVHVHIGVQVQRVKNTHTVWQLESMHQQSIKARLFSSTRVPKPTSISKLIFSTNG